MDIVEILRSGWNHDRNPEIDMDEVADEIEQLRARLHDAYTELRVTHGKLLASQAREQELKAALVIALDPGEGDAAMHAMDVCTEALALSCDTSAIDALRDQLAACEKERDRWKIDYLTADSEELASSQAENARLREALEEMCATSWSIEFHNCEYDSDDPEENALRDKVKAALGESK